MAKRAYFNALIWRDGSWCIEFGDYDREVVEAEAEEMRDALEYQEGYKRGQAKKLVRVVRVADDRTATIEALVAELAAPKL